MIKLLKGFVLISIYISLICAQTEFSGHKYIHIVIPREDSTNTGLSRYRIAGHTKPDLRITVNGIRVKVFKTGAFVKLLKLEMGKNKLVITAYKNEDIIEQRELWINRTKSENNIDEIIDKNSIVPNEERWISIDDSITFGFRGKSGSSVTIPGLFDIPFSDSENDPGNYERKIKVTATSIPYDDKPVFNIESVNGVSISDTSEFNLKIFPRKVIALGMTKGFRAQYSFSSETDRLGLSEINYMPPGIPVNITGKKGRYYRFQIDKGESAWIHQRYVDLFPEQSYPLFEDQSREFNFCKADCDTIIVKTGTDAPFITYQNIDPAIIVIKVIGLNSSGYRFVKMPDDGTTVSHFYNKKENRLELYISLKSKQVWGYSVGYTDEGLRIIYRKREKDFNFTDLTFVLDPGHGGDNSGALGATGALEKEVNLDLAKKIKLLLEMEGAKAYLLRKTDTYLTNSEKTEKLFRQGGDILLSIHCNSIGYNVDPLAAEGTSVYYLHPSNRKLAELLHRNLTKLGFNSYGIFEGFNLSMNSMSELPAVLIETAFLSNPNDEAKLISNSYRLRIATSIVDGLKQFVKWSKK